ncbi:MAG: hypothetical protein HUU11_07810 [Anaerolineales bacterium]|nr:hypothetical protein [Anaerolineales bacterium]NUQ84603.1 hypothetical protein [Anaerolineales bacterium]
MSRLFSSRNTFAEAIGLILFLSGLALVAYLGYYNRYWADDWCYNADLERLGFWGTVKGYTHITTYASNRFSLTLFSGLLNFGGVFGVQAMTGFAILFWVWGMYRLLGHINALTDLRFPKITILLVTAIIVYYSIHLAPHLYQSLYWRSGLLPYTAPVVFGVWVFALVLSPAVREARVFPLATLTGVLAFLGGGFSEAGNAALTAVLAVYVIACLMFRRREWARATLPFAVVALLASVSAMAVLIASPTTDYRLGLYEAPPGLTEFPRLLFYHTYEFLALNALDMPLTHTIIFGTLLLVGALSASLTAKRPKAGTSLLAVSAIAVFTFALVAASFAPSVYIESSLPALRARIIAQFLFILGYGLIAFLAGFSLRQHVHWQRTDRVLAVVLILFYAHGAYSVALDAGKIPLYAERAMVWDERDLEIRQSKEQGILEIHVRGIDGASVGGIRDFMDARGPGYWVNNCAVRYYGVEAIYATLP